MMKRYLQNFAGCILCFLFLQVNAQNKSRISFDKGWKFKLDSITSYNEPGFNDAEWRVLNVPHDWSIEGKFSKDNPATPGGGALPGGIGWYRKSFTVSVSNKNNLVFIDFDGVYMNSEIWVNGHLLGKRPSGYISFQYNLTPYLKYGNEKNVIAVKVDNSKQPNSRWYSGSGIYRNVWLTTVNRIHVDHWGTFISTPVVTTKSATIKILTKINNEFTGDKKVTVSTVIYDNNNKQVAKVSSNEIIHIGNNSSNSNNKEVGQSVTINDPILWSLEKPVLYKAVTQLQYQGKIVDTYETPFGIRHFYFDVNKGFFLNGKPIKILGVCDHHDLGALGSAINTRALQRQLEILKAMGCNGIRTSHNPPAPELLDLCDRMGFVVMDEAFDMWAKQKNPYDYHLYWKQWHQQDLQDQLLRDRNHPSVFIWSVGNEIGEQWGDAAKGDTSGRVIARELVGIVKSFDTSREIVTANNDVSLSNNIIQSGAFDMIGYNY
ncbi:MAG: beta galactosidase jelly roll domain-containing protein, partial [Bacteroidota bacterium]|nr:beta galactosidase jelly roll domain-containing protein [Bacteroidota bacterium]